MKWIEDSQRTFDKDNDKWYQNFKYNWATFSKDNDEITKMNTYKMEITINRCCKIMENHANEHLRVETITYKYNLATNLRIGAILEYDQTPKSKNFYWAQVCSMWCQ